VSTELQNFSPQLLKELGKLDNYLNDLRVLGEKAGVKPEGFNYSNALLAVSKKLTEHAETEATVKELGYTSVAFALKALGQTNRPLVELPAVLRHAPPHWVQETRYESEEYWKDGKQRTRQVLVRGTNARTAQRQRAGLEKDLQELWHLVLTDESSTQEQKDSYLKQVVECYNATTYFDFTQALLEQLNVLNGNDQDDGEVKEETNTTTELEPHTREELERFKQQCVENGVEYDEKAALLLLKLT
jgi:hypothetical protein